MPESSYPEISKARIDHLPDTGPCKFPRRVTNTAQYVAVPMKISLMSASVSSEIMIEKMKSKTRITTVIDALLMEVKKNRITGIKRIITAKKTAISFATMLMRALQYSLTAESLVCERCCLVWSILCCGQGQRDSFHVFPVAGK